MPQREFHLSRGRRLRVQTRIYGYDEKIIHILRLQPSRVRVALKRKKKRFLGENCDEPVTDRIVGSNETEKSSSGAFAGMFVAVLLLAAIVTLFLYYRKRVATLKTVIAHVQYGADPLSNPGTGASCASFLSRQCLHPIQDGRFHFFDREPDLEECE